MKNCIFTPTFKDHFKYINNYLESFAIYVEDAATMPICFLLSSESELAEFNEIIKPYEGVLNINIYIFDEIIKAFGIKDDTNNIIKKYGSTSYQTLKKLYGMLYIDADNFFVLDSEAAWIRSVNMNRLIDEFIQNPFVVVSYFSSRTNNSNFLKSHFDVANYVCGYNIDTMFFEHFMWIYSKDIIKAIVDKYGQPYDLINRVYDWEIQKNGKSVGLMEAALCLNYIYENAESLGYRVIYVENELKKYLGKNNADKYISRFFKISNGGKLGLIEFPCDMLDKNNTKALGDLFRDNNIWITRCDEVTFFNRKNITNFLTRGNIAILAVGQDHIFLPNIPTERIRNILWKHTLHIIKLKIRRFIKKE